MFCLHNTWHSEVELEFKNPAGLDWAIGAVPLGGSSILCGFARTDQVPQYMLEVLHWLPFPQCISFRVMCLVWRCLWGSAPSYLRELCCPMSYCIGHRVLHSSAHGDLFIQFAKSATMQRRCFSAVGPTIWNKLPQAMCHPFYITSSQFHSRLETTFSAWFGSGVPKSRDL